MSILYRYTKDINSSQDLLQDTFIKVFSKLENFDLSKGSFENWSSKIAVNMALQYKRKRKELLIEEFPEIPFNEEDLLHDKLTVSELRNAIDKLPEVHRVILNMYYYEDYNHQEISELLGIKKSSSRSQLSRARILLQERWSKLNMSGI